MSKKYISLIALYFTVVVTFYFTSSYFSSDYINIEKDQNHKKVQNLIGQIKKSFSNINSILVDYANWDQTYEFIQNQNQAYIYDNFREDSGTLEALNLDFMLYTSLDDKLLFSKFLDTQKTAKLEEKITKTFEDNIKKESINKSFVRFDNKVYFVVKTGTTNSDATKPINGYMYAGKLLNSNYLNNLDISFEKIDIVSKYKIEDKNRDYTLHTNSLIFDISKKLDLSLYTITNFICIVNNKKEPLVCIKTVDAMSFYKQSRDTILLFSILISLLVLIIFTLFLRQNRKLSHTVSQKTLQLQESEALLVEQSRMAAMGEMIGNIAHQLKQPLNLISTISSSVVVQKDMKIYDDKNTLNNMKQILQATNHLSDTIDEFRDFFKPKKNIVTTNIETVIEKSINLTKAQLYNRDIKVKKDIKNCELKLYDNQLLHVILNVVNNARDELTKLENSIKRFIFISTKLEGDYLILKITDNAGGVDESNKSKIFDAYFTTKKRDKGTGIGLYMSKKILKERLNGTIEVSNIEFEYEDIKYKGACFTIKIPKIID
ncbi:MAG: CHASE4 domain-containing protein [Campylobacterota bacterium]